ncbi:hypothetical protein [Nocardia yamanashiensis]|uniref:hypothetical protein n=1 Tax=Nocardia yamanashiensis TaxID=209247 RepID=UPI00157BE8A5|nr:hypothetical protein [Nocardia yamanashiensis]
MADDRAELRESWRRTREHLAAACTELVGRPDVDLSEMAEYLEHNELGLAFDVVVHIGDRREVPFSFWQHLDRAARQMGLYSSDSHGAHHKSAETCRRRVAAGPDDEDMSQASPQDVQPHLRLRLRRGVEG